MTVDVQTVPAVSSREAVGRVSRFTRTERAVHWVQATTFIILLVTGFALALPQIESLIGNRALLREIHLTSAFFFFFGPAIVAFAGDRRSVARDVSAVDSWDRDDLRWLIPFPILRAFGIRTPAQGRFNAGQKLNAIFVVWSTLVFTGTGFVLWQNRRFPSDLVSRSNDVHTVLAYIALAAFLGHVFLATAHPKTKHSFRAITQGWVREDWAREHHLKWVQNLVPAPAPPRFDGLRTGLQIVLGSATCLFACRVLFFAIGANTTDKTTARLYDVTAWPGAASIQPQTGVHIVDGVGLVYGVACLAVWIGADQLRRVRHAEP